MIYFRWILVLPKIFFSILIMWTQSWFHFTECFGYRSANWEITCYSKLILYASIELCSQFCTTVLYIRKYWGSKSLNLTFPGNIVTFSKNRKSYKMLQVRIIMAAVLVLFTFFLFSIKKINLPKYIFNWFDLQICMIFEQGTFPFSFTSF